MILYIPVLLLALTLNRLQAAVAEVPVAAIERDLLATFPKPETSFSSGVLAERSAVPSFVQKSVLSVPVFLNE